MEPTALDELIRTRRTIKPPMMSEAEVSEADLSAVLENANWAPTHGMTQPWRFRVYRGAARARLADDLANLYLTAIPPEEQKEGKAEKLRRMPTLAPVVILVCMERQKIEKIRELEEIEAVACAVQNMHLTATARGLGGFWSTPPFLYKPEMNAYLGLGEKDRCLGIFYLGHPAEGEAWPEGRRQSVDERVEFVDA
ncbi:MAG: nitroreductase [Myxococcota bacterium]